MNQLEPVIIDVLNNWHDRLTLGEPVDCVKYEFSKNKFRDKYLKKTGEFLKITKRLESISFSKICYGLSKKHNLTEDLLDKYLDWCFENYDFFIKKYKQFTLNAVAEFAIDWNENLLKFEYDKKDTLEDLKNVEVHKNIYFYMEKYGIPLTASKLIQEKPFKKEDVKQAIIKKLNDFSNTKEDLNKMKNMLRNTVENGPYSPELLFSDYKDSLSKFFMYFTNEPWSH
jgi:hypothetical protein